MQLIILNVFPKLYVIGMDPPQPLPLPIELHRDREGDGGWVCQDGIGFFIQKH